VRIVFGVSLLLLSLIDLGTLFRRKTTIENLLQAYAVRTQHRTRNLFTSIQA
jgi:hypothetical protein